MKTLIIMLLTLSTLACPYKLETQDLCINIEWIDGPNDGSTSTFKATLTDRNDENVAVDNLEIFSWMIMPNMQHGGPAITWTYNSSDEIEATSRFFMGNMMGHWEVRFKVNDDIIAIPVEL